jgi:iron complex transport system permease protein
VRYLLFPALGALLLMALLLNAGIGAVRIAPLQSLAILFDHLGIDLGVGYTRQQDAVLWAIRIPRMLLAALVGASLGLAGAVMQGVFRNPLADPSLIGVSSGAALGAVVAIVFGVTFLGAATLPVAAFIGGLLATLAVYGCARHQGRIEVVTLVLTGIALNAIAGAGIGFGTFMADDAQLRSIVFWSLGSVGGATWTAVLAVLPAIGLGVIVLPWWGRQLNLLVLGEREARHLGLETERVRFLLIVLSALVTGAAVSVAVIPRELPMGVVTAMIGGPFFLWLVYHTRTAHGGWG